MNSIFPISFIQIISFEKMIFPIFVFLKKNKEHELQNSELYGLVHMKKHSEIQNSDLRNFSEIL